MERTNEVLAGLLIVKELNIKILNDEIKLLKKEINDLNYENNQLLQIIEEYGKKNKVVGFKQKGA